MKKHIITIAGKLGSGKSSTGKKLAEILGYERASTGDFMRSLATSRGMTLNELNIAGETDLSIDQTLDDNNREVGTRENVVLDSRLGFYFIPNSFKVFLELDSAIAAERVLKDAKTNPNRGEKESSYNFNSVESITASITERLNSERKRFFEIYGIKDQTAHENFDLVIDTGTPEFNNNIDAVVQKVIQAYNKWLTE
jgi:cytidylate kinase